MRFYFKRLAQTNWAHPWPLAYPAQMRSVETINLNEASKEKKKVVRRKHLMRGKLSSSRVAGRNEQTRQVHETL
jgi:hypothetical protein